MSSVIPIEIAKLDALRAKMRLWLIEVLALIVSLLAGGPLARDLEKMLRADIGDFTHDVKRLFALYAFAQTPLVRKNPNKHHLPRVRMVRRASALRRLTHAAFRGYMHGSLQTRLAKLRDLLANPERLIARLQKRLRRGFRPPQVFAQVRVLALTMPRVATQSAAADTS